MTVSEAPPPPTQPSGLCLLACSGLFGFQTGDIHNEVNIRQGHCPRGPGAAVPGRTPSSGGRGRRRRTRRPPVTDRRLPFFVYGTLLPGERNHPLLAGRTRAWTPAVLTGALLYRGPGYPFAVADPAGTGQVHGEVVEIWAAQYDAVRADLDRLETYTPGDPANRYERVAMAVRTERGQAEAWVYLAGPVTTRELLPAAERIPGGDWRRRDGLTGGGTGV
ncbi:gamma-glutamylcyclotransferase family protein [Actinacidiphila bryophytorum]|uniref:Gamma-glutamylcyclotransferase family protein (Modular protein) n=1 Tax=Actinacidiphila bryophytorum TaxID=1436133 RepID=A0A9W4GZ44_9ACTN|nr:gamma-glutamylcyclotransferase family protein [Actinacidiphila bryophytorum]CAG7628503.1 Gamma-glutamylcyclotransferase family protein (modular protein) [Actinacidiphila bryophytorum]